MTTKLPADDRKRQILLAALTVATRPGGWSAMTRIAVSSEAGLSEALVSKYFGTMICFRRAVMREAVRISDLSIIAQGLAAGDKCAQKASDELKREALATLVG